MKKVLLIMITIITVFVFEQHSIAGVPPKKNNKTKIIKMLQTLPGEPCRMCDSLNKEHEISLDTYYNYYDNSDFTTGQDEFKANFFYIQNNVTLGNTDQFLKISDLEKMFTDIINQKKDGNIIYKPKTNYAALRMRYGLKDSNMIIIFEPIVLKKAGNDGYRPIDSTINKYYRVMEDNSFKQIDSIDADGLEKKYRDSVFFIHDKDSQNHGFNYTNNLNQGDIHWCTMTFQQIMRMYWRLKEGRATPLNAPKGDITNHNENITFSLVARHFYSGDDSSEAQSKIHVVAHINLGGTSVYQSIISNLNLGADFSQLCPNQCKSVPVD